MIPFTILFSFIAAALAPLLVDRLQRRAAWVLFLLPASLALYYSWLLIRQFNGDAVPIVQIPWISELGMFISFKADGLSLLFALLISGTGTLIVIYSGEYLEEAERLGRFYAWLLFFMAAMLGIVLADSLILLYVFWELTSLSSFILIGFDFKHEAGRNSAWQALMVTEVGGLALLAGLVLLGLAGGTFEITSLYNQGDAVRSSSLYLPITLLIALGAFTKSAQFPFHFWLPNAMQAPTPVSAYLHSATMVKAGIYLLARMRPILGGTETWISTLTIIGGITMLAGGLLALLQKDLKRLLAYATVSVLGLLVLLIGIGTPSALEAATVTLLAHALYKGALFMVAGIVDHESGTRDISRLKGLGKVMPVTAVAAGLAAFSMAGFPPSLEYIAKELYFEVTLMNNLLAGAVFLASVLLIIAAGLVGVRPFWGRMIESPKSAHTATGSLVIGPMILAVIGLLIGLFPGLIRGWLIQPAAVAISQEDTSVNLEIWHGFTPAFLLSLVTLILGVSLYTRIHAIRRPLRSIELPWGPDRLYSLGIKGLDVLANWQTQLLVSGYLRYYLMTAILTMIGLVGGSLLLWRGFHWPEEPFGALFYEVALGIMVMIAALVVVRIQSSLGSVAALGFVGLGVGTIFLLYGGPDLALAQFLIESLTVLLFVFVFYRSRRLTYATSARSQVINAVVALLSGGVMTALVLSAIGIDLYPTVSGFFAENSLIEAHGRNVVNVILVDFRAFDTMGEVTVLACAAVGVYALLKLRKG